MGGFTFRLSGHLTFGAVVEWWQVWQGWSSRLGNYRLRATPGAWPKQLCVCVCVLVCVLERTQKIGGQRNYIVGQITPVRDAPKDRLCWSSASPH